jgi:hypothetical protein
MVTVCGDTSFTSAKKPKSPTDFTTAGFIRRMNSMISESLFHWMWMPTLL